MQTYEARVRLAGSMLNEVPKFDLTPSEISILRRLHGSDAVIDIKPVKHVDRDEYQERARLAAIYNPALRTIKGIGDAGIDMILGPEGVPLAKAIPGVDSLPAPTSGRRAPKKPVEEETDEPALIPETEFN